MTEVLRAYRWYETGQVALWLGADPPQALLEGITHYHSALNRVLAKDLELKQELRDAQDPPPDW